MLHYSVDGSQTKAGALAFFLGGKERLENVGLSFGIHSAAIVRHRQHHIFAGSKNCGWMRKTRVEFGVGRFDRQAPAFGHCVACIHREVQNHLLDLATVGLHQSQIRCARCFKLHVLADQAPQYLFHVRHDGLHVQDFWRQHLFATERQQLTGQRSRALRCGLNLLGVAAQRIPFGQPLREQIRVALYDHQKIIEIVGDSPGQPSDSFHFLGLP